MNLYCGAEHQSLTNTQEHNHADALQRAEALLKKLEKRIEDRANLPPHKGYDSNDSRPIRNKSYDKECCFSS